MAVNINLRRRLSPAVLCVLSKLATLHSFFYRQMGLMKAIRYDANLDFTFVNLEMTFKNPRSNSIWGF